MRLQLAQSFSEWARDLQWLGTPLRSALAIIAAMAISACALSWSMPFLEDAEGNLETQFSFLSVPESGLDRRIALVVYTDSTLVATQERSPLDRTTLARALNKIDTMGAKGIAIDIVFDQPAPDDDQLITALRSMKTPVFIGNTQAKSTDNFIEDEQRRFSDQFYARIRSDVINRVDISLPTDANGILRQWPHSGRGAPLLANAFSPSDPEFEIGTMPIVFRRAGQRDIDPLPVFESYPIDLFSSDFLDDRMARESVSAAIRGRIVLIGSDVAGTDRFTTPVMIGAVGDDRTISGLEAHAHMLAQRLDARKPSTTPWWLATLSAVGAALAGLALSIIPRRGRTRQIGRLFGLVAVGAASVTIPPQFDLSYFNSVGCMISFLVGSLMASAVRRSAASEKGRTATQALHRYLPPDIAQSIVTDPNKLGLTGERRDVFALFTDLEGFTTLCHAADPHLVAHFLNEYLEALSQTILSYGGTIDKFVGDAVVAFWGAPVSLPDDGERTLRCSIALQSVAETFRGRSCGTAVVGRTRIGIHFGSAIIGNFGGDGRLQYTALGDTMNVASRLEAENKRLGTSILASDEAYRQARSVPARRMGRVSVRGRAAPLDIWEPIGTLEQVDIDSFNASYEAALGGDTGGITVLEAWIGQNPADRGAAWLVETLKQMPPSKPST